MEKKVTYVKIMGVLFLCASLFILLVSLWIGPSLNTLTGFLLLIISIMYLSSPAVVYSDEEIQLKNLLGITMKRYKFEQDKITVKDNKIYANGKRLGISKAMLVKNEYNDLLNHVNSKSGGDSVKANPKSDDDVLDSDFIKNS